MAGAGSGVDLLGDVRRIHESLEPRKVRIQRPGQARWGKPVLVGWVVGVGGGTSLAVDGVDPEAVLGAPTGVIRVGSAVIILHIGARDAIPAASIGVQALESVGSACFSSHSLVLRLVTVVVAVAIDDA